MSKSTVLGVGYLGSGPYRAFEGGKVLPAYKAWAAMLQRAYSPAWAAKYPTYTRVTVCAEWHNFQNFAGWYSTPNSGRLGFQLDKDLRVLGCAVYSPVTCSYVPQAINKVLTDHGNARGDLPVCVGYLRGRYQARVNERGIRKYLGIYDTVREAFESYRRAKEHHVKELAQEFQRVLHPEVFETLMKWEVSCEQ